MKFFDPRSIFLARHAQHVVLVHFPIALCLTGIAFDFAAQWNKNQGFWNVAYYNLTGAALSTIPVLATGLLAWQFQLEGQRLRGALLLHLVLAVLATAMIWTVWGIHWRVRRTPELRLPSYRVPLELITAAFIASAAHLGGILSGVNAAS